MSETVAEKTPQSKTIEKSEPEDSVRRAFRAKEETRRKTGLFTMPGDTRLVLMLCSAGSSPNAEHIADTLIAERLAACVQITPISSIYRWEGAVHHDSEFSLQIKTSAESVSEVESMIKRLHEYELPEIIVLPIIGGSMEYLGWLAGSLRGVSQQGEESPLP